MQNNKRLNLNIQGMRGLCALMVFGGHVTGAFNLPWIQDPQNPLRMFLDGHAAVIFFFFLSGYFYYTDACIDVKKYIKLIVRRIVHLIPPYWISIMMGAILCNYFLAHSIDTGEYASHWMKGFWQEPVTIGRFLNEAKVVLRNAPASTFINPPSWYLSSDFKAMMIIPLVILLLNKTKWFIAPVFVVAISAFSSTSWFLAIFLMGAILHKYQHLLIALYDRKKWLQIIVVIIGFVLWQAQTLIYNPDYHIPREMCIMEMLEAIGVFLLLSVILKMSDLPVLTNRFLLFMGRISYEFYIIHFIFLLGLLPFISNVWVYIPICFGTSVLVAIVMNKGGRWFSKRVNV